MRMRTRKLIGTVALLALVTGWALLAMVLAQVALPSAGSLLAGIYIYIMWSRTSAGCSPRCRWSPGWSSRTTQDRKRNADPLHGQISLPESRNSLVRGSGARITRRVRGNSRDGSGADPGRSPRPIQPIDVDNEPPAIGKNEPFPPQPLVMLPVLRSFRLCRQVGTFRGFRHRLLDLRRVIARGTAHLTLRCSAIVGHGIALRIPRFSAARCTRSPF
jgi:hypothetical protein